MEGKTENPVEEQNDSPMLNTEEIEEQTYTETPDIDDEDDDKEQEDAPNRVETHGFATLGASMYASYMPQIMSSLFRYRESRLMGLPSDTIKAVRELNKQIETSFNIDPSQQSEIQASLDSYLKTVNFKAPSPLTQLLFVVLMPILGGSFVAMNLKKEIDKIVSDAILQTESPLQQAS